MGLPVEIVIKSVWSKKSKDKFKSKGIANLSGSDSENSTNVCVVEARIRFG